MQRCQLLEIIIREDFKFSTKDARVARKACARSAPNFFEGIFLTNHARAARKACARSAPKFFEAIFLIFAVPPSL